MLLPALAALGFYMLYRKKPVKAVLASDSSSTMVKGPKSGILYAIAMGEAGDDGRKVHSVYNGKGELLFAFVQDESGGQRSLMARAKEGHLQGEITTAVDDFGFTG